MNSCYLTVSSGIFSIQETNEPNSFIFYRKDEKSLSDKDKAMYSNLLRSYILTKTLNNNIPTENILVKSKIIANNVTANVSSDGKYITLIASNWEKVLTCEKTVTPKLNNQNFIQRLYASFRNKNKQ